jgi:hypothetical protein
MLASDNTHWFYEGSPENPIKGIAKKAHFIHPGADTFKLSIPIGLSDKHGCKWKMMELWMYAWHPLSDMRNDLLMFSFSDRGGGEYLPPIIADNYNIFCQPMRYAVDLTALECAYPGHKGQITDARDESLAATREIVLNIKMSDDIIVWDSLSWQEKNRWR